MKCENEKPNYTYMNNYTFGGGEMRVVYYR